MDFHLALLLILVGILSFFLGRFSFSSVQHESVRICTVDESILMPDKDGMVGKGPAKVPEKLLREVSSQSVPREAQGAGAGAALEAKGGEYVASKNGKAYHFPWCSGAQRIKPANQVWFETKEAAEAAGYLPAGNCKGL